MPYKHIAAHLKKTELACRLHYHQLSFGNKRHRRTASTSSFASVDRSSMSPTQRTADDMQSQRQLPAFNPSSSPHQYNRTLEQLPPSPPNHVPILPRTTPVSQRAVQYTGALRLITGDMKRFEQKPVIDISRLKRIYNIHRIHFWSMIAQSYGDSVSPSALEEAWRREIAICSADFPPTPCSSPESAKPNSNVLVAPLASSAHTGKGFTPINPPQSTNSAPSAVERGAFAISSLLTEDKEVKSPGGEKGL